MQAILLQRTQITCVPLSVFLHGHPKASSEIGERPFPFFDGCNEVRCRHRKEVFYGVFL